MSACDEPVPASASKTGNGYLLEKLFDVDGVSVYRFQDRGEWRYLATSGSVSWTEYRQQGKQRVPFDRQIATVPSAEQQ